jgi:hypothetical protein
MTRVEKASTQRKVAKILDEVGEVGPLSAISDERLASLVTAGKLMVAAAGSHLAAKMAQIKLTAYLAEQNRRK